MMEVGAIITATVTRITQYGLYLTYESESKQILVTLSEIGWERCSHPSEVAVLGDRLDIMILKNEPDMECCIGSIKAAHPEKNPWLNPKLKKGQKFEGIVISNVSYGSFIQIIKGIEGLLHVDHGGGQMNQGERVQVVISDINFERRSVLLELSERMIKR